MLTSIFFSRFDHITVIKCSTTSNVILIKANGDLWCKRNFNTYEAWFLVQPADRTGAATAVSPSGLQQRDGCEHMACELRQAAAFRWALDTLKAVHVSGRVEACDIRYWPRRGQRQRPRSSAPQRAHRVGIAGAVPVHRPEMSPLTSQLINKHYAIRRRHGRKLFIVDSKQLWIIYT